MAVSAVKPIMTGHAGSKAINGTVVRARPAAPRK